MLIIDPCLPDQRVYRMSHKFSLLYALPNNYAACLLPLHPQLFSSDLLKSFRFFLKENKAKIRDQLLSLRTYS